MSGWLVRNRIPPSSDDAPPPGPGQGEETPADARGLLEQQAPPRGVPLGREVRGGRTGHSGADDNHVVGRRGQGRTRLRHGVDSTTPQAWSRGCAGSRGRRLRRRAGAWRTAPGIASECPREDSLDPLRHTVWEAVAIRVLALALKGARGSREAPHLHAWAPLPGVGSHAIATMNPRAAMPSRRWAHSSLSLTLEARLGAQRQLQHLGANDSRKSSDPPPPPLPIPPTGIAGTLSTYRPFAAGSRLVHRWLARPRASVSGGAHRSMRGGTRKDLADPARLNER